MVKSSIMADYQPSPQILQKYADVLVNFALNSGQGVKPGEVVLCQVPDVAKPLALKLQNTILKAGAQPLMRLLPTGFAKDFYTLASDKQIKFFPAKYLKAQADLIDHRIAVIAEVDPFELKTIDPKKPLLSRLSLKPYQDWLVTKELKGQHTWAVALWGTSAKARLVGLSLKAYWQQINRACFLDQAKPLQQWRQVFVLQKKILGKINALNIQSLEIKGKDVDLHLKIGSDRLWEGGTGRNIPSFEIFTSPNWRGTEGWIKFNQPLYRYGNVISGISLNFKAGRIIKASASSGNKLLQQMITTKNADKLGEFSLTDKRLSRITHVMAETLFDENMGGPFGNTHVAIGMAYKDCFKGNPVKLTASDWVKRGYNDSAEHTDMISTSDRTVTAALSNGQSQVIYQHGRFTLA
ncbi:MAG: aminopeptidase [Candidatus Beckwithbacteria bacterium]|nr:aminopeptidase [Candidatus Beckwithbacteria bacterium]